MSFFIILRSKPPFAEACFGPSVHDIMCDQIGRIFFIMRLLTKVLSKYFQNFAKH